MTSFTKKDFHVDWFSGTGPGGQHRNKHQNCCRITHIASGLRAQSTRHRSREANKTAAFTRLAAMLVARMREDTNVVETPTLDVVRTYRVDRSEVIDHASGERRGLSVLEGELDDLLSQPGREGPRPGTGRV